MKFEFLVAGLGGLLFTSSVIAVASFKNVWQNYSSDNLNISQKNNESDNRYEKIDLESQDAKFEVIN